VALAASLAWCTNLLAYPTVKKSKPITKMSLKQIERYQIKLINLDRWIIRTRRVHKPDVVWFSRQRIKWTRRELRQTRSKLKSVDLSGIAHRSLWLCLHSHEASNWYDRDSGGNGHYGGLQMSKDWLGYFKGYASSFSPEQQMWYAEKGYRDNHYSSGWLWGQWGQTLGYCTHFI
jgi:hypothetical protein